MSSTYVAVNTVQFRAQDGENVTVKARDLAKNDTGLLSVDDIPEAAAAELTALGALRPATAADLGDEPPAAADAAAADAAKKPGKPTKADPAADEKALLG